MPQSDSAEESRKRRGLVALKQDLKPFLEKMAVVRQCLAEPLPLHDRHRAAVRVAVVLIQARLIQAQGLQKRRVNLPHDGFAPEVSPLEGVDRSPWREVSDLASSPFRQSWFP